MFVAKASCPLPRKLDMSSTSWAAHHPDAARTNSTIRIRKQVCLKEKHENGIRIVRIPGVLTCSPTSLTANLVAEGIGVNGCSVQRC